MKFSETSVNPTPTKHTVVKGICDLAISLHLYLHKKVFLLLKKESCSDLYCVECDGWGIKLYPLTVGSSNEF